MVPLDRIGEVVATKLRIIPTPKGSVYHVMKAGDVGYMPFQEAYLSQIDFGEVKGWRMHSSMTLNLTVVHGNAKIAVWDDRPDSSSRGVCNVFQLGRDEPHYFRLTIPPRLWVAIKGVFKPDSLILNIADRIHDQKEAEVVPIDSYSIMW